MAQEIEELHLLFLKHGTHALPAYRRVLASVGAGGIEGEPSTHDKHFLGFATVVAVNHFALEILRYRSAMYSLWQGLQYEWYWWDDLM